MTLILTAEQMRRADATTIDGGVSAFELMQRAGQAVAECVRNVAPDSGRMVVIAGRGNNGGDGYAAASELFKVSGRVTVVALVDPALLTGAAAEHARLAAETGVKIRLATSSDEQEVLTNWLSRAVMVVDAIFGTGLSRPLDGWVRQAVQMINDSDRPVLAVDIPSGVHGDAGRVMGAAVRADWTLPIVSFKWGHWLAQGRLHAGVVLPPADIGISDEILDKTWPSQSLGIRHAVLLQDEAMRAGCRIGEHAAHKGSFGHVWVFGGSVGFTGAPRLAAAGAMAVHAGLVSIVCPQDVWPVIAAASLEVMVHSQNDRLCQKEPCQEELWQEEPCQEKLWQHADAVVAGPGWGMHQQPMLEALLSSDKPLLLDADALNMLVGDDVLINTARNRKATTVFTPHPGEAARLLGEDAAEVQKTRPAALLKLVEMLNGWVVLKGAETLIASPDGRILLCPFGSNRLATAGAGDVLSGMIGALLAHGMDAEQAISAAVVLHAKAGEGAGWHRAGQLADRVAEIRDTLL
ncbi:MAG: NAD(P)H-hydrate dehydratase [Mariprofundaceae bacterium]